MTSSRVNPGDADPDPLFDSLQVMVKRYAVPTWFGRSNGQEVHNGTATLVRLAGRSIAITCRHVLDGHDAQLRAFGDSHLQVGGLEVEPAMIVSRAQNPDLAAIDVTKGAHVIGKHDRVRFWEPGRWPPAPVGVGDLLYYCGFPGQFRNQPGLHDLVFSSLFALGEVASWSEEKGYTHVAMEKCHVSGPRARDLDPTTFSLGGMSGGPVFAVRDRTIVHVELVGFIVEYSRGFDVVMMHPASLVQPDATIPEI